MINFAFGLTLGIVVGAASTFVAGILVAVVVEDSPNILDTIKEIYNND